MTPSERRVIKEDIRAFIRCLLNNGFKASSIARAANLRRTHAVINNSIGYAKGIVLINTYSNNWALWKEKGKCVKTQ